MVEQLEFYQNRNERYLVKVFWHPSCLANIPKRHLRKDVSIIRTETEKSLVLWKPTTMPVERLMRRFGYLLTCEQVRECRKRAKLGISKELPWSTKAKDTLNKRFSIHATRYDKGLCVFLDAENARTLKAVLPTGIPCVVVNDSVDTLEKILQSTRIHEQQDTNYLTCKATLTSYLERFAADSSISLLWADYCVTFYTKKYDIKRDIRLMRAKLSLNQFLVAFTFSLRCQSRSHKSQLENIVQHITLELDAPCVYKKCYRHMVYLEFSRDQED